MTRPFQRVRAVARRMFEGQVMDRLIDPVIADIQHEHAQAISRGRFLRARWVQIAGWFSLANALFLYAIIEWVVSRTVLITGLATAAITLLFVLPGLLVYGNSHGGLLALYLLPQALLISMPVGFAIGVLSLPDGAATQPKRRLILAAACGLSMATFLKVGWVAPAANQEFRLLVFGNRRLPPGINELSIPDLRRLVRERESQSYAAYNQWDRQPPVLKYETRLALCAAPLLMAWFSVAAGAVRRRRIRGIHAGLALSAYVSCFGLLPPERVVWLLNWLPPLAVAWIPNTLLILAALACGPLRALTPAADLARNSS